MGELWGKGFLATPQNRRFEALSGGIEQLCIADQSYAFMVSSHRVSLKCPLIPSERLETAI
jgi:hypothetical protein